ncbi:protein kinase [Candidatus Woesearchaeota archaeon]|nr:protein kinase [Candidatus Woesearchaeota archaeon]
MTRLNMDQKREILGLIEKDELCNIVVYLNGLAQEDPDPKVTTRRMGEFGELYKNAKNFFWRKLDREQKKMMNQIVASAYMLHMDYLSASGFLDEDKEAQETVLRLAKFYGKYEAIAAVNGTALLNGKSEMMMPREEYDAFLERKVIPNIPLLSDGDDYYIDEDILNAALSDLGKDMAFLSSIAEKLEEERSYDLPRRLLLSIYSGDKKLIAKAEKSFNDHKGIRKNIDQIVDELCKEEGFEVQGKIQTGDDNDFYPLSANLWSIKKNDLELVLKENIRYRIDFSCIGGYNMEVELYSKLQSDMLPRFYGKVEKGNSEFMVLEKLQGDLLTRYTNADQSKLLDMQTSVEIVKRLAGFVNHLNDIGVIYADMKDKNVLYDNDTGEVKIVDLGMASDRMYQQVIGNRNYHFIHEIVSNAEYACPETAFTGRVYKESEVFQLGIMFYKLLTGKHPFHPGSSDGKHATFATEDYEDRESELIGYALPNIWNRPSFEQRVFKENPVLQVLLTHMLDKDFKKRPSASYVMRILDDFQTEHSIDPYDMKEELA